jgi:hypothetical protein
MMVIDLTGDSSSEQAEKQSLTREKRVSDFFCFQCNRLQNLDLSSPNPRTFLSRQLIVAHLGEPDVVVSCSLHISPGQTLRQTLPFIACRAFPTRKVSACPAP